jgi:hypothetical protein
MRIIKGMLEEELQNSLRMKKGYENALSKLPQGSLAIKRIKGREYCYLAKRVGKKVKYIYKGKMPEAEKKKYEDAKKLRAKYRSLLSQVKKQIRFLRSSLRGKEAV